MKGYAVFAGGGAKGAALAGAYAAADEHLNIQGFGGTSAGSIVATLGAVGYSGQEVRDIMLNLDFNSLLDDNGERFRVVRKRLGAAVRDLATQGWSPSKLWKKYNAAKTLMALRAEFPEHGIYDGNRLRDFLTDKICMKIEPLRDHADITFEELRGRDCKKLKIVASDISSSQPVLFSVDDRRHGTSVLEAVRASVSYPGLFKPVIKNGRYLVDGGIASNLPAFLFFNETRTTRIPTFAFDLVHDEQPARNADSPYTILEYLKRLLNTSLEASDVLLRTLSENVRYIPISIPDDVNALSFDLDKNKQQQLFDAGYRATSSYLSQYAPLDSSRLDGGSYKAHLQKEFGGAEKYDFVMRALIRDVLSCSDAHEIRANIMLPTGRGTRIVVFTFGFQDHSGRWHSDADLELGVAAGCSGLAWSRNEVAIADLTDTEFSKENGITDEQLGKIPPDRKSMISVPIPGLWANPYNSEEQGEPIGVLSLDSSTALDETKWKGNGEVIRCMQNWAYNLTYFMS